MSRTVVIYEQSYEERATRALLEDFNVQQIVAAGRIISRHFTLMCFTTNYRASFSTPNDREEIQAMPCGDTEREAVIRAYCELMEKEVWGKRPHRVR